MNSSVSDVQEKVHQLSVTGEGSSHVSAPVGLGILAFNKFSWQPLGKPHFVMKGALSDRRSTELGVWIPGFQCWLSHPRMCDFKIR